MRHAAIAVVLIIFAVLISYPAQGQRTESEVSAVFAKAAADAFDRAKARPSPQCADLVRDFVGQAATTMADDKRTSDREVSAAVQLVQRFAAEMVKHAERQADGTLRLSDNSFAAAQKALCPLYPFC